MRSLRMPASRPLVKRQAAAAAVTHYVPPSHCGGGTTGSSSQPQQQQQPDYGADDDDTKAEVMREAPRPELTLAQKYNLVKRPPEPLTEEQWAEAHAASKARSNVGEMCAICRDDFRAGDQVLLSCSHVFHERCIKSFEKFAHEKCCPICRSAQYQKRRIRDGQVAGPLIGYNISPPLCTAHFDDLRWVVTSLGGITSPGTCSYGEHTTGRFKLS